MHAIIMSISMMLPIVTRYQNQSLPGPTPPEATTSTLAPATATFNLPHLNKNSQVYYGPIFKYKHFQNNGMTYFYDSITSTTEVVVIISTSVSSTLTFNIPHWNVCLSLINVQAMIVFPKLHQTT